MWTKAEHDEEHLRKIADEIGVDRAAAATTLHLPGGAMPADLTRLWIERKPGQRQALKMLSARLSKAGYEIVKAKGTLIKRAISRTIEEIEALSSGEVQ